MKILVTGSSSGLGQRLVDVLNLGHNVFPYDMTHGNNVLQPDLEFIGPDLDCLINCAGINRINWLEDFGEADWNEVINVNAKGIYMMTRACQSRLIKSKGTVVNIVSNASHVPMTCSLAYNASKAAAHIMTLQLARELTKRYGITVFGVSPNKMAGTKMSRDIERQVCATRGWTAQQAHEYQKTALLNGEETPPERVADFIAFLLSSKERHKYLSGTVIPYGA